MDMNEFRRRGHEAVERIARYYEELEQYRVSSNVEFGYLQSLIPEQAPEDSEPWEKIMKDFEAMIMPGMTHWQHPHFYAYFPANASFPALIADMYSDMINCIGFNWHASPACTELETIVLDWMAKAFALPRPFLSSQGCGGGMIQGTTSESITTVIIAARDRFKETGPVNGAQCVAYGSTQTHVCTKKGAMIANVEFKEIQTNDQCQLTADAVEAAILKDLTEGKKPIYITLTIGTTSSGAVDDIQSITKIAKKYNVWVHVDAAWAGAALVCQEYQYLTQGLEHVDSISMNMHKWLLTNFDCCCLWVKRRQDLTQALSVDAAYLQNTASQSGMVTDYRNWQIPFGRRFRALKIWFVVRSFGIKGLQIHIRKHVELAKEMIQWIESRPDLFEIVTPLSFALFTFRVLSLNHVEQECNDLTAKVLEALNEAGKIMVTSTTLHNKVLIRFVPGSPWVESRHIKEAFEHLCCITEKVRLLN